MLGNGFANVIAAAILAVAIVYTGGFNGRRQADEKEIAEIYARAVGDIRNDIVVNCGCCGEGQRKAEGPF